MSNNSAVFPARLLDPGYRARNLTHPRSARPGCFDACFKIYETAAPPKLILTMDNDCTGDSGVEMAAPAKPSSALIRVLGYEAQHASILLSGQVNESTMLRLCAEIDLAIGYYKYSDIQLLIDSPGGELRYLEYYLARLDEWRRRPRFRISTVALTEASSAAAIILTMGDVGHRSAYPSARILVHDARFFGAEVLDRRRLSVLHRALSRMDRKLLRTVATHIHKAVLMQHRPVTARRQNALSRLLRNGKLGAGKPSRARPEYSELLAVLRRLQSLDIPLSAQGAMDLFLIDQIKGSSPCHNLVPA